MLLVQHPCKLSSSVLHPCMQWLQKMSKRVIIVECSNSVEVECYRNCNINLLFKCNCVLSSIHHIYLHLLCKHFPMCSVSCLHAYLIVAVRCIQMLIAITLLTQCTLLILNANIRQIHLMIRVTYMYYRMQPLIEHTHIPENN